MARSFSKIRAGFAIFLALASASPALAQSAAPNDVGVGQQVLGPASMLPDIAKMSPAEVVEANAGIRGGIESAFREKGIPVAGLDVSSEVVVVAGQGVIKTRVQAPSRFYYQFTGIANGNAVIVVCVPKSARPFNPTGTECERRVNAVFGPGERG